MLHRHRRRARVMYDYPARPLDHAFEHRVLEIFRVRGGARTASPKIASQIFAPGAIVVHKFLGVFALLQAAEKEMVQHGIVKYDDARFFQSAPIDLPVQWVVSQVIQRQVGGGRVYIYLPERLESA